MTVTCEMSALEERICSLFDNPAPERSEDNLDLLLQFRDALNRGEARVIDLSGDSWKVNIWVKKGILLHTVLGLLSDTTGDGHAIELDTLPRRRFAVSEAVRVGGESAVIRDGTYFGPEVTCMQPLFVNMGVYMGAASVLDSNCMVGLCAQIGERVHVGPAAQIGGFISPLESMPTIIGDDVTVGGGCCVYGGVSVGQGAILMPGTVVGPESRLYDLARKTIWKGTTEQPLAVPPQAIVLPGAVPLTQGVAAGSGLFVQMPVITSYRDDPAFTGDPLAGLML